MAKVIRDYVVVTGASGGIGQLLLKRLAAMSAPVIAASRYEDGVPAAIGSTRFVKLDLEDEAGIEAAAQEVIALSGSRIGALVNLAGIIVDGPLELVSDAELKRQFAVNVFGPMALTRLLAPALVAAKGRIVNIGAASARLAPPFYGPIAASKAAFALLSDALRMELAPFGVRVSLLELGAISGTRIFSRAEAEGAAALRQKEPSVVRRYGKGLERFRAANARTPMDKPEVAVEAIIAALTRSVPPARSLVGRGSGVLPTLAKLPVGLRDGVLMRATGLHGTLGK